MSDSENYNQACRAILQGLDESDLFDRVASGCLRGIKEGKQYAEIAKILQVSEGTVKARASNLWGALGRYFNQKVSRYNVHALLDGYLRGDYDEIIANHTMDMANWPLETVLQPQKFVGRQQELIEVGKLVHHSGVNLLLGVAGVGKSALIAQYIHLHKYPLRAVIWQTIETGCRLKDIANAMGVSADDSSDQAHISVIVEALQQNKYLLVLDQSENLVKQEAHERLSISPYSKEYSGYEGLIKAIMKRSIKSSIIITSRVPFRDLERARANGIPIGILHLGGVTAQDVKLLMNLNRIDTSEYQKLCDVYEGNPGCLRDALLQVNDLYGGNVDEFLRATLYLSRNFRNLYQPQLDELTKEEIGVLKLLQRPLKFIELEEAIRQVKINISRGNLVQILEMLQMSQLVEAEIEEQNQEKRFVANGIAIQCIR